MAALPLQLGRYLLVERLAVGGMAEIFKAQLTSADGFEKTLVVKRLLPQFAQDPHFVEMFRDEARLTVRLNHANIVQVFEFGREGEDWFLAMEYLPGRDLLSVLKRARSIGAPMLPASLASYVAEQVARALAFAHTRKDDRGRNLCIIHRDVTPSNILLSWEGDVKVTDFGIAKAASRTVRETQAGLVKGKVAYLAPEQLSEQGFDARVDLFALGACLWEMLAGRRMVQGDTEMEMLDRLQRPEPFPLPAGVREVVPSSLERGLMKAVARDPAGRYPDAASFQADLLAVVMETRGTSSQLATLMQHLFAAEINAENANPSTESTVTRSISSPQLEESTQPRAIPVGAPSGASPVPRGSGPVPSYPPPPYPPPPPPGPDSSEPTVTAPASLPTEKDDPTATLSRSSPAAVTARADAIPGSGRRPVVMITGGLAAAAVLVVALAGSYVGGRLVGSNSQTQKALEKAAVTHLTDAESAEDALFLARLHDPTSEALTRTLWQDAVQAGSDHSRRYAEEYLAGYHGSFVPDPGHAEEVRQWQAAHPLPLETVAASSTPADAPPVTPLAGTLAAHTAVAAATPVPATPSPRPTSSLRPETQVALEEAKAKVAAGDLKGAETKIYVARLKDPQAEILTWLAWKYAVQATGASLDARQFAEEYRSGLSGKFTPLPDHLREITGWLHLTEDAGAAPTPTAKPASTGYRPEIQQALDEAKAKAAAGELKAAAMRLYTARFRNPQEEILTYSMWRYSAQGTGQGASAEAVRFAAEYLSGFNGRFTPDLAHRAEILQWRVQHPVPPSP